MTTTTKTKFRRLPKHVDMVQVEEAIENDEDTGFCLACGEAHDGIEPDARKYKCDACGEHKVYGAQEIALMCF